MSKNIAVIGLGFGDEGKGKTVSSILYNRLYDHSLYDKPIVVRFSGGHQAGHTVIGKNGYKHVFTNFGSGSLQGVPTYWSKYCTVEPIGLFNELDLLKANGLNPILYIDKNCPVTTPYDFIANIEDNNNMLNGSCGVGVGKTIKREEDFYSLTVYDLKYKSIFRQKLKSIDYYYKHPSVDDVRLSDFMALCTRLINTDNIIIVDDIEEIKEQYNVLIFEGSQGLLLDQHYGFFPNVTRSNTGVKNILEMGIKLDEVFYVTRAYQNRHGNGFMTNVKLYHKIPNNPHETNIYNEFQGSFNKTVLDLDLLKYSIEREKKQFKTSLVITCLDLMDGEYPLTYTDENNYHFNTYKNYTNENEFIHKIKTILNVDRVFISHNPDYQIHNFITTI